MNASIHETLREAVGLPFGSGGYRRRTAVKTNRLWWIALAVLLSSAGGYLVVGSIRDTGGMADGGILLGGALVGLAVFPLSVALQQYLQARALERHMRRGDIRTPGAV